MVPLYGCIVGLLFAAILGGRRLFRKEKRWAWENLLDGVLLFGIVGGPIDSALEFLRFNVIVRGALALAALVLGLLIAMKPACVSALPAPEPGS